MSFHEFNRLASPAALTCALLLVAAMAASLSAADFRMENKVFLAGEEKPISQSTTIFYRGAVYDFLEDTKETIVFDQEHSLFVLLDPARQIRSELTTEQVGSFVARLQQRAAAHSNPFIRFSAKPSFEESFDENSGTLTLASPRITYRASLIAPEDETIASQYARFTDAYSSLNAVLHPGSRPPAARLSLNDAMARRRSIAREVHLTLVTGSGLSSKPTKVRSEHAANVSLSQKDLDRIAKAQEQMQKFRLVDFGDYRRD